MSSRDIDAIWSSLKAKNAPSTHAAVTARPSDKPIALSTIQISDSVQITAPSLPRASTSLPAKPFDANEARQALPKLISSIQDPSPSTRKRALEQLSELLLPSSPAQPYPCKSDQDNATAPPIEPDSRSELILEELEGGNKIGKALLRRFDDPSEACRDLSVSLLTSLISIAPHSTLSLLPYVMPVLQERIPPISLTPPSQSTASSGKPTATRTGGLASSCKLVETCEEIRLKLALLFVSLLRLAGKACGAYAAEALGTIKALIEDPYHEVNIQSCHATLALNGNTYQPLNSNQLFLC